MQKEDPDALKHATKLSEELTALADHLRKDIGLVYDPKAKALFETSAEVIIGLKKAFQDYIEKQEDAWQ